MQLRGCEGPFKQGNSLGSPSEIRPRANDSGFQNDRQPSTFSECAKHHIGQAGQTKQCPIPQEKISLVRSQRHPLPKEVVLWELSATKGFVWSN